MCWGKKEKIVFSALVAEGSFQDSCFDGRTTTEMVPQVVDFLQSLLTDGIRNTVGNTQM
jgi:hypothetical protein